jgi:serine/threonine protein kinase/formylglycine-generating enzyme required for sulfatase activity
MNEPRNKDELENLAASSTVTLEGTVDATMSVGPDAPRQVVIVDGPRLPERYRDLGRIAAGGFGEIRRVHDTLLDRVVAMKLLRVDMGRAARREARFVAEAKLTAGLEHPGIVSVHDRGWLDDGRLWFTMREVRGRTLGDVIDEVHAAAGPEGYRETASGWTFRRLVDAFARVCQAVAYAHRRGIVHRDLKPDNIMVGELGEALVMDWGLGRRVGAPDEIGNDTVDDMENPNLTQYGEVLGTPAYMPPEQALGQRDRHGLPSDVYALGAVLYHLLAGRPPYEGASALAVLRQVVAGPPRSVVQVAAGKPLPAELSTICDKAMAREMEARHANAEDLSREVFAWLDGARRREQALEVVAKARAMEPEMASLRAQASAKRKAAQEKLDGVRPFDPVDKKEHGWALEDEANRLEVAAALREAEWLETLQGALTVDPDLPEAHAALAEHHRDELLAAERAHREADVVRAEARLRAHDRGQYAALLRGEGRLSLVTDPPGAEVILERYVEQGRRLVPKVVGTFGPTPLREMPLEKGSYRLRIRAPDRAEVFYPVLIERGGHWDGVAPGESEPYPIVLPREGELGPDECYVPAGWCWVGGDPEAPDSLPARRIWVDAFVIGRFPVTNGQYVEFLNALIETGREEEARSTCPRKDMGTVESTEKLPVFERNERGRFVLPPIGQDASWQEDVPVVQIDWHAASAYAAWVGQTRGEPWRLPNELEREKASRGVDGRIFPWGDHGEATFACVLEGHRNAPIREHLRGHPTDESVYSVRGLAGNVRDWCINTWKHEGPALKDDRLCLDEASADDPDFRAVRGGYWGGPLASSRSAGRFGGRPGLCRFSVGFRLAWSYLPSRSMRRTT